MEIRPVVNVIGYLSAVMGGLMLLCGAVDAFGDRQAGQVFFLDGVIVLLLSACTILATAGSAMQFMDRRQAFLLTSLVWSVLPAIGAVPLVLGLPHASLTDAYFEAMSGMTTTGSTVFHDLEQLPYGVLLWRGILQWLGGLGIVIVAMIFLPAMRVGGMQFFLTEGFDTLGKIMPRAKDIARSLLGIYIFLTLACFLAYLAFDMPPFDAVVHALTTISTGGFSTSDASFGRYTGPLEYVSAIFMILASFPLIRFVQAFNGHPGHLFRDVQVRAYLRLLLITSAILILYRLTHHQGAISDILRETFFNVVTLFSGTGYASEDITRWGGFAITLVVIAGLVGGCTGSTACSIKVFRWLILWQGIRMLLLEMRSPNGVAPPRLAGKRLEPDVIDSVIAFFTLFILTLALITVGIALTGLSFQTSVTAAWTAVANIGPAFGQEVGGSGSLEAFPAMAKWIMIFGMLAGRLEILSLYVLFTRRFWRG